MKPKIVDLVFVLDASESMRPCFEGLAQNIDKVVNPLQGMGMKVRLGLIAINAGKTSDNRPAYWVTTLGSPDFCASMEYINSGNPVLFTENNAQFIQEMRAITLQGDEDQLLALDCALDFPFGHMSTTRRVVAMFSDECLEDGITGVDKLNDIDAIVAKIMARKVLLFAALPTSDGLERLGQADSAQIEPVAGGEGLASVNFGKLLGQMAKSISTSSLQAGPENYIKGTFGQYQWGTGDASVVGLR